MSVDQRLRQMIEAERAAAMAPAQSALVWERLASTVTSGAKAMTVPLTIAPLTTVPMVLEGAAIAVLVGAVGATAIVTTAREPSRASVTSSAVQSNHAIPNRPTELREQTQPASPSDASIAAPQVLKALPPRVAPSELVGAVAPPKPALPGLDQELLLIKRAKLEIDRGQAHLGRVWLDEHRSRFPAGLLAAERDGLEILLDCGSGPALVAARVRAYSAKYPGSALLDRIRRACQVNPPGEISK